MLDIYSLLDLLPQRDDGSKSARLARFGRYEVRLVEYRRGASPRGRALRVELFDHGTHAVLEDEACCDVARMKSGIARLIARAAWLDESDDGARPDGARPSGPPQ